MKRPLLYQINTRIVLQERGEALGRPATFDDLTDESLDQIAQRGFEWVWFLGVWQTGAVGRELSRRQPEFRRACAETLPGFKDEDICGSPFAIVAYEVNRDFGGNESLARIRERLAKRGLRLLLDFVPNHVATDHPWTQSHLEYFIRGTDTDLAREPQNYSRFKTRQGEVILAYGRDPYFSGWSDTLQLNYRHPACRQAMQEQLAKVAEHCDGVRCDMAMLVQPQVFQRTWGDRTLPAGVAPVDRPFWSEAIPQIKREHAGFLFIAEVYWDMEWELQQQGFDFTYDKRLYDRLHAGQAKPVREHLMAAPDFQEHSLRFLENHDEPRAATAFGVMHFPAAVISFLVPGMRFFHEGQFEGRKVQVSMHIGRRPKEKPDPTVQQFYSRLLDCLKRPEVHEGKWRLWSCRPAWDGNWTWEQFIVFSWEGKKDQRLLAVVNYGSAQGQCYVTLGMSGLAGRRFTLADLLSDVSYDREGDGMAGNGLYLDMPPWGYHLFEMMEQVQKPARKSPLRQKPEGVLA